MEKKYRFQAFKLPRTIGYSVRPPVICSTIERENSTDPKQQYNQCSLREQAGRRQCQNEHLNTDNLYVLSRKQHYTVCKASGWGLKVQGRLPFSSMVPIQMEVTPKAVQNYGYDVGTTQYRSLSTDGNKSARQIQFILPRSRDKWGGCNGPTVVCDTVRVAK